VRSGATTRRLVGTIRATGTTTTEDSKQRRYVSNLYNRVERSLYVTDATTTWTHTSPGSAWRQARADSGNAVAYVDCIGDRLVQVQAYGLALNSTGNAATAVGIGIDSTSAIPTELICGGQTAQNTANCIQALTAFYR